MKNSISAKVKNLLFSTLLNKAYICDTKLRRSVERAICEYAKGTVIDVGCGTSPYQSLVESRSGVDRYIGMEYPGARDYFGEEITSVDLMGDVQDLPIHSETVDLVLCLEVIEHVPEPEMAMREVLRVLKPSGVFILSAPSTFKLHMEPHDYHRFTKYGLQYLLSKMEFKVITLECRGKASAAVGQTLSSYLHEALVINRQTGQPSLWRAPFILPLLGLIQAIFLFFDRFTKSETLTIGYTAISQK